jgi:hypothetical protein
MAAMTSTAQQLLTRHTLTHYAQGVAHTPCRGLAEPRCGHAFERCAKRWDP